MISHPLVDALPIFIIYTSINLITAAIIDTKTPIVIQDIGDGGKSPGSNKNGSPNDTYFGYSLAFMKGFFGEIQQPSSVQFDVRSGGNAGRGTLFIGAPNERQATKNSGVVWQCKFDGNNAQLSCSILNNLSNDQSQGPSCSGKLHWAESATQQWIGSSLSTNASSLFAGAPRWKMNGWRDARQNYYGTSCSESAVVGACYVMSSNTLTPKRLEPLNQPGKFYYSSQNEDISQYLFLYAELGFSTHVTLSNSLVLGAPSVRTWTGALVEYQTNKINNRPTVYNEGGQIRGIQTHSYLGYSVTSGRIRDRGEYIASGAPAAANLLGAVVIISKSRFHNNYVISGDQFGSYFGYTLVTAALDIFEDDSQRNDYLFVGAPMYTSDFTEMGYNTGCVLIFNIFQLSQQPIAKLCMNSRSVTKGARFGSAIANLGDINFDKREDFAISAPYDDGGVGTVFIYYGEIPISDRPAQVIRGKSMSIPNLLGFGTHLLGGKQVDIDGNGTPDLVFSSFESRHVVALRTRPVATVSIVVTYHTADSDKFDGEIFKLLPTQQSFRVRVCVVLKFSVPLPVENQLDVWLHLEIDPAERRVGFQTPSDKFEQIYQLSSSEETCLDKLLSVRNTSDDNNFEPILSRANLKYNQTVLLDTQPIKHAVIQLSSSGSNRQDRDRQDQKYQQDYRSFNPYLPAPIPPTRSRWERLEIAKDNCDSDGRPECDPQLSMNLEMHYGIVDGKKQEKWTNGKTLLIGQIDTVIISIVTSNRKETAYRPTVRINLGITNNIELITSRLRSIWQETPGRTNQCADSRQETRPWDKELKITFNMRCPQPMHEGTQMKYTLEIGNLKHLKIKDNKTKGGLTLTIDAYPESRERDKKVSQSLQVPLEANVVIGVESRVPSTGQSAIDPKTTRFVDLTQLYIIKNSGFTGTAMEMVGAVILVPTHVNFEKGNKWTRVISITNPSSLNVQCEAVNSNFSSVQDIGGYQKAVSNTTRSGTVHSRSSRSTSSLPLKVIHPEKVSVSQSSDKFVTLSGCDRGDKAPAESCQKIECVMDLPSKGSQEIRIQMYLSRETIGKLVSEETKGIRIDSTISIFYNGKMVSEKVGSTERSLLLVKSVPAWIYLASGAGGTILFLLITFALFKCGFFKRKRKEELKKLKRQTMQQMDAHALLALDASIQEQEEEE